ncbi:MAG: hypothetical protein A4E57_01706 [Syntrophorhabdaceae bacterium PtaU1.Bin034]|nr:MAG: hypothetical protein A4E57_01706 [Syntrophorhabdaceae bacterium PtaU1.Bin034]
MSQNKLTDVRSCYNSFRLNNYKISTAQFVQLPLHALPTTARAFMYALLSWNRGKLGHAFSFLKLAKDNSANPGELACLLHVEATFLFLNGDHQTAILRERRCADLAQTEGDKRLQADALSHLSSIYEVIGERRLAKEYERQASRLLFEKEFF